MYTQWPFTSQLISKIYFLTFASYIEKLPETTIKSRKEFKINFWNFCLFLAYFEQKVAKNMFFVIFLKMAILGQNLTLPMCSFNEFV